MDRNSSDRKAWYVYYMFTCMIDYLYLYISKERVTLLERGRGESVTKIYLSFIQFTKLINILINYSPCVFLSCFFKLIFLTSLFIVVFARFVKVKVYFLLQWKTW